MNTTIVDPDRVSQAERSEAVQRVLPLKSKFHRLMEQYHLMDIVSRMRPGRGKSWAIQLINDREQDILLRQAKGLKARNWLTLLESLRGK